MMQTIYMDNASTSYPKAPGTAEAMCGYLTGVGGNAARGSYGSALAAGQEMLALRQSLCRMFHSDCPESCILTPGATYGINMVLKGLLHSGDHVVISAFEHNAVMRPLRQIGGLRISIIDKHRDDTAAAEALEAALRPDTKLVCVTAASNVSGEIMPVKVWGEVCQRRGVPLMVDASQAAGHVPLDCGMIDALVFPAHKGLLGPQGIGAALLKKPFAKRLAPFVTGGTGTHSELEEQPQHLPDKLEAGTPNLPGVYGFAAALRYAEAHETALHAREQALIGQFLEGLKGREGIRLLGQAAAEKRIGVFSLDFLGRDNSEIAVLLESRYGILTRVGLHCAPMAHRSLGSFPQGAVRFSLGWQTTPQEIAYALNAIVELAQS